MRRERKEEATEKSGEAKAKQSNVAVEERMGPKEGGRNGRVYAVGQYGKAGDNEK